MASKGQKFNKYTAEQIAEILALYQSGNESARTLGEKYHMPEKTIKNWITKYKHGKDVTVDHRKAFNGRTKEEKIDYKERYEILKKYQAFIEARREKK